MNEYGCNVCDEEYSANDETKCPRVLTGCGHTICQGCATSIAQTGRPSSIFCPFDRISTVLPGGDIRNLKKNFALLELLERISDGSIIDRRQNEPCQTDKYAKERLLNIECDEDQCHVAVIYCTVCDSNLCEICAEITHSTNVLSKHKRVPLTDKPTPLVYCKLHASYCVEFVCKEEYCDSENRMMCLMCRDYGRHKGHRHIMIENELEELKEKLREFLNVLGKQTRIVDTSVRSLDIAIQDLSPGQEEGQLVETRQEVRAHFRQLRANLDRDESAAIDKLETYARERVESLTTNRDRLMAVSTKIGSTCIELQKALILEKSKLLEQKDDLIALAESTNAEPASIPDDSQLCTRIAFSISNDRRLHIGDFIDSRVVFLGLDGSGKTSIVRRLKKIPMESVLAPHPTIGFNVELIHYKNYRLSLWDVGGLPKLRHLWKHYYSNAQCILYIIDGDSYERYSESLRELTKMVGDPLVGTCPVFVGINRKDGTPLNGHLDALLSQISALPFQLQIFQCDAASGSGIDQLIDQITVSISRLNGEIPV